MQELQSELVHISRLTAMGEMASTLAHELNQPLSAIANYLKGGMRLLQDRQDEESRMTRDALDKANEQAMRAGRSFAACAISCRVATANGAGKT